MGMSNVIGQKTSDVSPLIIEKYPQILASLLSMMQQQQAKEEELNKNANKKKKSANSDDLELSEEE